MSDSPESRRYLSAQKIDRGSQLPVINREEQQTNIEFSRDFRILVRNFYHNLKATPALLYQKQLAGRGQIKEFCTTFNKGAKTFNSLRNLVLLGHKYPADGLREDVASANSSLQAVLSKLQSLPSKERPAERDYQPFRTERSKDKASPRSRLALGLSVATLAALTGCAPEVLEQTLTQQAQASETSDSAWLASQTSEVEPIDPATLEATVTPSPTITKTPIPTETATPTEVVDPLLLTEDKIKEIIEKAISKLPKETAVLVREINNEEKINAFLSELEAQGIIGSREILAIEDNLSVDITNSGRVVVRIGVYTTPEGETFHDYCITESMDPADPDHYLIGSLEGAKEYTKKFDMNPDWVTEVKAGGAYRIMAVDENDQPIVVVSANGQWLPVHEAIMEQSVKNNIDVPANLGEFNYYERIDLPLFTTEWGPLTTFSLPDVKIRHEDVHIEKIDLGNGYVMRAWADAWGQLQNGDYMHYAVPLMVEDTKNNKFKFIFSLPATTDTAWNEQMVRSFINSEIDSPDKIYNYGLYIGNIPQGLPETGNDAYRYMKLNLDFWSRLLQDLYTEEQIQQFAKTADPTILATNKLGAKLPKDFIFYLNTERRLPNDKPTNK